MVWYWSTVTTGTGRQVVDLWINRRPDQSAPCLLFIGHGLTVPLSARSIATVLLKESIWSVRCRGQPQASSSTNVVNAKASGTCAFFFHCSCVNNPYFN